MNVISAGFGSEKNSLDDGVIIITDDLGAVASCTRDAPYSGGAWEALQQWLGAGNTIADYVPPTDATDRSNANG